ncbi:MAG: hypothetical protein AAGI92_03605 [Pseudomonadota bacterium]
MKTAALFAIIIIAAAASPALASDAKEQTLADWLTGTTATERALTAEQLCENDPRLDCTPTGSVEPEVRYPEAPSFPRFGI